MNLGRGDDGRGGGLDDDAPGLHDATHHVGGELVADGAIEEQAVTEGRLLAAYGADDGAWDGSYIGTDA